jgi:hypothetical protein
MRIILVIAALTCLILMSGCVEELTPDTMNFGITRDQHWFTDGRDYYGFSMDFTYHLK